MSSEKPTHVPTGLHLASRMVAATAGMWKALGNLETSLLAKTLREQPIVKPVFVSGVARAGSTILTEVIAQHPMLACHRYSDFPLTYTPYWWNSLRERLPLPAQTPQERAHRDRLMITPDSPEAIEEILWMHFFPTAHTIDGRHVMNGQDGHPLFETFYQDHIRKLLIARHRQRYLAKNNYHTTRLEYLLTLFPDARFIIPVRSPVPHVESLLKQHRLFSELSVEDPRVSRQLQLSGHFEFGPLRSPIIVGPSRRKHYSSELDDVAWYASQWADVYGFLYQRLQENEALANACLVVPYEVLCSEPEETLQKVFAHLQLFDTHGEQVILANASRISAPEYYQPALSGAEAEQVRDITAATARLYDES